MFTVPLLIKVDPDLMDQINEKKRKEQRPESLFGLYPEQDEFDMVERRSIAEMPAETLVSVCRYIMDAFIYISDEKL